MVNNGYTCIVNFGVVSVGFFSSLTLSNDRNKTEVL